MSARPLTFAEAQDLFRRKPRNNSAGLYLDTALEAEAQDKIGQDIFLDAVTEVTYWLLHNKLMEQGDENDSGTEIHSE